MKKLATSFGLLLILTSFVNAQSNSAFPSGGGGGSPGGANTNVQFNNSGSFGGDSGFTYAGNGQVTHALGTITTNNKGLLITGTFNNGATTFDAPLQVSITNTASAAASRIFDFGNLNLRMDGALQMFGVNQNAYIATICQSSAGNCPVGVASIVVGFDPISVPGTPGNIVYGGHLFGVIPFGGNAWDTGFDMDMSVGGGRSSYANDHNMRWFNNRINTGSADSGFARNTAGVMEVNNGTLGTLAEFKYRSTIHGGSVPTSTGTCAVNTQTGGNTGGTFKANGACAAGTVILTFAFTAPTGWVCDAHDMTTPADLMNQTATSTTTVTLTGTMANLDVVAFKCDAF